MNKWVIWMVLSVSSISTSLAFADLGSIVQTAEGAQSDVKGSISDINNHTLDVFKQLGISSTGMNTENSGAKQTLKGKKNDMDVQVQLTQSGPDQTHVVVIAKQGSLNWNKDFAKDVLSRILQSS